MFEYSKMSWNEVFSWPISNQVQEVFEFYRERFEMIVEDLRIYKIEKPIILEGAAFFPELINNYSVNPNKVIYIVPAREFQLHHYQQRPWIRQILRECEDPKKTFDNWMMRDQLFCQEILRQAKAMNYETMLVDGNLNEDEQFEKVSVH